MYFLYISDQKSKLEMKKSLRIQFLGLLLSFTFAATVFAAATAPMKLHLTVTGRAVSADDDGIRNDIHVSGRVLTMGPPGDAEILLTIEVTGPDLGDDATLNLQRSDSSWNEVTFYEATFRDIVTTKGFYEVEAEASWSGLSASKIHRFDPPGGGSGPLQY